MRHEQSLKSRVKDLWRQKELVNNSKNIWYEVKVEWCISQEKLPVTTNNCF
jgi:hypothetical protein